MHLELGGLFVATRLAGSKRKETQNTNEVFLCLQHSGQLTIAQRNQIWCGRAQANYILPPRQIEFN